MIALVVIFIALNSLFAALSVHWKWPTLTSLAKKFRLAVVALLPSIVKENKRWFTGRRFRLTRQADVRGDPEAGPVEVASDTSLVREGIKKSANFCS